jgi:hypothetical protein
MNSSQDLYFFADFHVFTLKFPASNNTFIRRRRVNVETIMVEREHRKAMESHVLQERGQASHDDLEKGSEMTMQPQTQQIRGRRTAQNDGENSCEKIPAHGQEPTQFPGGATLTLIIFSIWLALFLCALVSLNVVILLEQIIF